jgi:hypothetical protein
MLRRTKQARFTVLLPLLLILVTVGSGGRLRASDSIGLAGAETLPLLRIDPTLSLVSIGGTACADVRVEDVQNLFAFETVIRFDPARVHVVDAHPATPGVQVIIGPFLEPQTPGNWYVINAADNTAGTIRIAITRLSPESGASGSGILATICLQGVNRGHTYLTFSDMATLMLDPYVSFVPFSMKSSGAIVGPVQRHRIPIVARGF